MAGPAKAAAEAAASIQIIAGCFLDAPGNVREAAGFGGVVGRCSVAGRDGPLFTCPRECLFQLEGEKSEKSE